MVAINNSNNNRVGATNTGVTNTLTIDNASNTGSSSALVNVTVGGTSSGDPFKTFTVAGTTNWSMGADNSVTGDPFVISASTALGTTNIMSALTTGEINYPLQPAFYTKLSGTVNDVTGDGTNYTIAFDTELFDQNADVSGSTFTAPVTGRYQLNTLVSTQGFSAGMTSGTWVISTSNRDYAHTTFTYFAIMTAGTTQVTKMGMALTDMDAADTAVSKYQVTGGTKTADLTNVTSFSGKLIC